MSSTLLQSFIDRLHPYRLPFIGRVSVPSFYFRPNDKVTYSIGSPPYYKEGIVLSYQPSHHIANQRLTLMVRDTEFTRVEVMSPYDCRPLNHKHWDKRKRLYTHSQNPHSSLYELMDDYILMTPIYSQGETIVTFAGFDYYSMVVSKSLVIPNEGFIYIGHDSLSHTPLAAIDLRYDNGTQSQITTLYLDTETYNYLMTQKEINLEGSPYL